MTGLRPVPGSIPTHRRTDENVSFVSARMGSWFRNGVGYDLNRPIRACVDGS